MTDIVGAWRLVAAVARDAAGNVLPSPYGPRAMGCVVFNVEGRMMAVPCDARSTLPLSTTLDYSSYCGNYTFDGIRLVTRVDAASDPARLGTDQVHDVRFEGERIVLRSLPRQGASGAEQREIAREHVDVV
jgi:hypothetical protein